MNSNPTITTRCVAVAQRALNGQLSLESYRAEWPIEADADKRLWHVMHLVENFLVDSDIRSRDSGYDSAQRAKIKQALLDLSGSNQ